jgi:hypothetical protein
VYRFNRTVYQHYSDHIGQLFPYLYIHALSTDDFQPAFSALLAEHSPVSASTISRIRKQLQEERLDVSADGVYPKAGSNYEQMAVFLVVGLNRKDKK